MAMNRNLAFLLALAAGILVLCASASAVSPSVWHPLGGGGFETLASPVDAGRLAGGNDRMGPEPLGHSQPTPSILQSSPTPPKSGPSATSSPKPLYRPRPTATPVVGGIGDTAGALRGTATWWNSWGPGLYAAAGGRLRAAMGPNYLHRYVTACARGVCVLVRLTTSCACRPDSRVIDLSLDAFSRLAAPSVGVLQVSVFWGVK